MQVIATESHSNFQIKTNPGQKKQVPPIQNEEKQELDFKFSNKIQIKKYSCQ